MIVNYCGWCWNPIRKGKNFCDKVCRDCFNLSKLQSKSINAPEIVDGWEIKVNNRIKKYLI